MTAATACSSAARVVDRVRASVVRLLVTSAVCAVLAAPFSDAAQRGPSATVDDLHQALLDAMRAGPGLGSSARRERLEPVIGRSFDFEFIARTALGSAWSRLDAADRARMVELMRRLSVATYASRFYEFNDERFEQRAVEDARAGRRLVRTVLVHGVGEQVQLDYVLQSTPSGWRIVNVLADGVSELSLKRAQYAVVIRRDGVAALLDRIEAQVLELEAGGSGGG